MTGSPLDAGMFSSAFLRLRPSYIVIVQPAAKLGLLPKRPVSLLTPQPASTQTRHPDEDDEDELEYVENPFEENK